MLPVKTSTHIVKLHQKKYRDEFREFIVEGIKGVKEGLASGAEIITLVMEGTLRNDSEIAELIKRAQDADIPVIYCGRKDIPKIKTTETFPGVLAVAARPDIAPEDIENDAPIIALYRVNDPGNLGTIIRTADWFGIGNILLSEQSVDPYNPKVVRGTMGSIFRTRIYESPNIARTLKQLAQKEYSVFALSTEGDDIARLRPSPRTVYLFGSESHGIGKELEGLIAKRYTIPRRGSAESLNVAVAAGILMAHL